MKLIAFLLPQYHPVPENDRAWGKGFTEWTNTRKARSLYPGHYQPKEPYEDYYYNLTDPAARNWQAELAKQYGIYGFCYYHYWFRGKKLLEQPLEAMLQRGEPKFPFCFSWANESWTRKWDGGENDLIMLQDYGDEADWENHFYYLLNFFRDPRYIRIQNKPVFVIYRPGSIECCEEMLKFWNKLARKNGLSGIYFVRTLSGFELPEQRGFNASLEFEPHYTFAHSGFMKWNEIETGDLRHLTFDYDYVWQLMLKRTPRRNGEAVFPGAFVDWDNTPRLGARGQSCTGGTPAKFGHYLTKQMRRASQLYGSQYLFINAWNEWGEGTFLEPDKRYGTAYLEALTRALEASRFEEVRG